MPNYTKNYNLEKPLAAENFDIGSFNRNSEKIDEKLHEVDTRIDEIITSPAEGVSAQEIIDARDGETNLGVNIRKVKSQLDNNATQL